MMWNESPQPFLMTGQYKRFAEICNRSMRGKSISLIVDGGINAQQIGRQQNFTYQKERAAGYGSPFLLVF